MNFWYYQALAAANDRAIFPKKNFSYNFLKNPKGGRWDKKTNNGKVMSYMAT
jgi:hypothetical protein